MIYSLKDHLSIINKLTTSYYAYFKGIKYSEKFKNFFIKYDSNLNLVKNIDLIYPKLRRLLILLNVRLESYYSEKIVSNKKILSSVIRDYIINFYKDTYNKNVKDFADKYFYQIVINNDDFVIIDNSDDFYNYRSTTYDTVEIIQDDNVSSKYINTTIENAVIKRLKDLVTNWNQDTQSKFVGYYDTFVDNYSLFNSSQEENIVFKYNEEEFNRNVILSFVKLADIMFNTNSLESFIKSSYNISVSDDINSNEYINYIREILTGDFSDDLLNILMTGYFLSSFSIKDFEDIVTNIFDVIQKIPNLSFNYNFSIGAIKDFDNNCIKFSLSDNVNFDYTSSVNINIKNYSQKYPVDKIKSLRFFVKDIKFKFRENFSKKILTQFKNVEVSNKTSVEMYNNVMNYFDDNIINSVDIDNLDYSITNENVINFLQKYEFNHILKPVISYHTKLSKKYRDSINDIKNIINSQYQNNSIKAPYFNVNEYIRILDSSFQTVILHVIDHLKLLFDYIDKGLLIKNIEFNFPGFVKQIDVMLSDSFKYNVENFSELTDKYVNRILTMNKELINLLIIQYIDLSTKSYITNNEPVVYESYSKYLNNRSLNSKDFEYSLLSGNRVIYEDDSLIEYFISNDCKKYLLDLDITDNLLILKKKTDKYFIDFMTGRYNIIDLKMYSLYDLFESYFNYENDISLTSSKFSELSSKFELNLYNENIFKKNDDFILFNISSYLQQSYGLGYYLDSNISGLFTTDVLDKIVDIIEFINIQDSKYNILVTDISESFFKLKSKYYDISFYYDNPIVPIDPNFVVKSDSNDKYTLTAAYNLINTDIDYYEKGFLNNVVKDQIITGNVLFKKGFDYQIVSYAYRMYLTYYNFIRGEYENLSKYNILVTSSTMSLRNHIIESKKYSKFFRKLTNFIKKD